MAVQTNKEKIKVDKYQRLALLIFNLPFVGPPNSRISHNHNLLNKNFDYILANKYFYI